LGGLDRHNLLNWIFRSIFALVNKFITYTNIYHNSEQFKAAVIGKDHTKHGWGYTGKYDDLLTAVIYAEEIGAPDFGEATPTESYRLYKEQIKTLRNLILSEKPKAVFNFGICYAYIDSVLATEFPDIKFIGIDLSPYNKAFNDVAFNHLQNLTILSGDVFTHFAENDYSDSIFFHSRTMTVLPKEFILQLYHAAFKANFKFLVGFEQHGLSYETFEPYVFDLTDKPSVYWRNNMFIHNYWGILTSCGFKLIDARLFSTGHLSPDFQVLSYVGKRTDKTDN
jgi:hypothetical protein